MPYPHLTHYTINSGHSRKSYRTEVGQGVIDMLSPIIRADGGPLPAGLHLSCNRMDGAATFAIHDGKGNHFVTCGVAWEPDGAAMLWRHMTAGSGRPASPPPEFPWLAVAMEAGMLQATPETVGMLADCERCVAWAILEVCACAT